MTVPAMTEARLRAPGRIARATAAAPSLGANWETAGIATGSAGTSNRARTAWLALWMAGSIVSFITAALSVRALAKDLSVFEIMSVRSAGGLLLLLAAMAVRPKLRHGLATRRLGLHVARNSVHFVGQTLWALAITLLPFTTVFALEFAMPVWVALLAAAFLAERMTLVRAASVVLCLIGVLVILRPGFESFRPAALLALGASITSAFTVITTKKLTATETTFTILLWMNVLQLPMNLMGSDPSFIWKINQSIALPLAGIVIAGLATHLCVTNAFRYGDAVIVVPLDFLRVPLIALIGWSFYGEALDALVFVGAGLIIAGVLWNLRDEVRG